jgi:hypothetical protein
LIELSWIDKIFSKKEGERIEEIKISLVEVEDFLRNKTEKDFEPLKDSIKKEHENLKSVANDMRNQLKTLEEASYPERTYPIIIRKSVGSRKSFIDKMDFLIEHLQKPIGEGMASFLGFHDETDKLINAINLEAVKDYAAVKILFEKEGKEVVQSFFQIVEIDNKLGNMLKDFKEYNSKMLKTKEIVAEISKLAEELKENETDELEKTLKEMEGKVKDIGDELEKLPESDEWKRFLEMQSAKEGIKQSMQNKKSELIQSLSQIEIPLKKYNWSVKNRVLDCYSQKSFDLILSEDPRGGIFKSALRDIKMKILEEELNLKDSDKFLDVISKMIEDNTVGKIVGEYLKLSDELKKQEERIASQDVIKRRNNLESEMKRLKEEIREIKDEKEIAEKKRKKMLEDREQKLEELENLVNINSDKKILLQIN